MQTNDKDLTAGFYTLFNNLIYSKVSADIHLKNGIIFQGILDGTDENLNISLQNTTMTIPNGLTVDLLENL